MPAWCGATVVLVYVEGDPGDGFEAVGPTLEDVYFATIRGAIHGQPAREAACVRCWVPSSVSRSATTRDVAALLEPYGFGAFGEQSRYWIAAERNSQVPALAGVLLQNRLLWGGVEAVLLALNLLFPNGVGPLSPGRLRRHRQGAHGPVPAALRSVTLPRIEPAPVGTASLQQFLHRVRFDAVAILRSVAFWVVLVLSVANSFGALVNLDNLYGTQSYPVTRLMVDAINGAFAFVPMIIAATTRRS